jgi:hypothetical protein
MFICIKSNNKKKGMIKDMAKSYIIGIISGILGLITCFIPSSLWLMQLANTYYTESITVNWYWLFQWVSSYSTHPSLTIETGLIFVESPPLLLFGITNLTLSIGILSTVFISKTDSLSASGSKKLLIIFGMLLMTIPWIEYFMALLGGQINTLGLKEEYGFGTGVFLPIPIGTIVFVASGILAIVAGAKFRDF